MTMSAVAPSPVLRTGRTGCILGTAGHIDHGKSSLVQALTGTNPDRLPEEQARGMTIELGFAHLNLSQGDGVVSPISIGIVDVPGHERFVRTMVAGATGIDLAMLVVAADDGVMPQTREHVEILDLLGITRGLIAITKADLVREDRIETVREQIAALVAGLPLSEWPVVVASARSGLGLDAIRRTVAALASELPDRAAGDVFRLAIDRVFAVHGRGTVVTGSVLCGQATTQSALELLPARVTCRVRELQSHGAAAARIGGGQRAALNLTGLDREQIERGMELATPGYLTPTRYVDARVRFLLRGERAFLSHQRVRVCMGTRETLAMLVVIGARVIEPGGDALAQLRFAEPVVCAHGQRFILRNETAQVTLGGGAVIRPVSQRLRRAQSDTAASLQRSESADARMRLEEVIRAAGFESVTPAGLACATGCMIGEASPMLDVLRDRGVLIRVTPTCEVHRDAMAALENRAMAMLARHHAANPAQPGLLRDRFVTWLEKRSVAGIGRAVAARLEQAGRIVARGPYVADGAFQGATSPEDAALLERIVEEITAAGFDPPGWAGLRAPAGVSRPRNRALEELARCDARLVLMAPQQFIAASVLARFEKTVRELGADGRRFTLAQVRDALGLSRRVVQPLLEHLDRARVTRRVGDERVLMEGGQ